MANKRASSLKLGGKFNANSRRTQAVGSNPKDNLQKFQKLKRLSSIAIVSTYEEPILGISSDKIEPMETILNEDSPTPKQFS